MIHTKFNIGVIFGGASEEHEISIKSAQTIIKAFNNDKNKDRYEVIPFYIDRRGSWFPPSIAEQFINTADLKRIIKSLNPNENFAFNSLPPQSEKVNVWFPVLHGPNGEDGTIQGLLKLTGKPFVGSDVLGSALGMDKIAMKAAFKAAGLPQVPYISLNINRFNEHSLMQDLLNKIERQLNFPCFIKPANLGSSVGVTKAYSKDQLIEALKLASSFDSRIVVEKNVIARELECGVIGKLNMRTSVVGEVQFDADWYNYETKYSTGTTKTIIPADIPLEISSQIRELSLKACEAVSAHSFARVDFFYEDKINKLWINEINTMPGFTTNSMFPTLWKVTGLNLENLVDEIVEIARNQ